MLRELFKEYGPCLILIDEWVAYARQLHDQSDLPAGGFETQFSFARVLTESAKLANNCLLVVSLPASDTSGSPHAQADDVEVGGQRGREALDRLRNVVGRIESSWRPASAEEGFEIVRRRLFEPFSDPIQFKDRDVVARAFADYLPRVSEAAVLLKAIGDGVGLLTWEHDAFAFADSFDDEARRYRGLRAGQLVSLSEAAGLLVKPVVARRQIDAERSMPAPGGAPEVPGTGGESPVPGDGPQPGGISPQAPATERPIRFHGTVDLDSARVGRDASQIADEIISLLYGLMGAEVTVTLEIQAKVPSGAPDNVVRTVTENARTLKFTSQGFERE